MTRHIFNGRTLSMIANEHGLSYEKLYWHVVTRGLTVTDAVSYLLAKQSRKNPIKRKIKGAP